MYEDCTKIWRRILGWGQKIWLWGYKYDGRQKQIAEKLIENYNLKKDAKILDVGCGKGFLLYKFKSLG